ncbi:hypothetical protein [Streptacidiphilus fuscans]|uniref:Uncharacterized protein n=1 Tax=Streptacidiphilus fuscans TaxID=2789292 RepID=A0A931B864_9ACTN|nr:hypothetical protein [Streptacidiphilus fuscans]MBF9072234.1 hypothetical protein [Streptacidiphilus fuscans]
MNTRPTRRDDQPRRRLSTKARRLIAAYSAGSVACGIALAAPVIGTPLLVFVGVVTLASLDRE